MKTDDRTTRQRDEVEGDEAKVVRLRDWLAPEDELVPFGPRAHAHAATREQAEESGDQGLDGEPPAASGFWDGDASVHAAVPGPGTFDAPDEPTADPHRFRRPIPVWRPSLPPFHPFDWISRGREGVALPNLVERISWRWAAAGVAFVALALILLVITLGTTSSGRHDTAAEASVGGPPPAAPSVTLGDIGSATRAASVMDLRRLPSVDVAIHTLGVARQRARALQARHRRHAAVATAAVASSSTTGSVESPTTASAPAPAETTPAPSETEPAQPTSSPAPATGGGASSSSGSSSGSQKQSNFGATGALGPGSSPNG